MNMIDAQSNYEGACVYKLIFGDDFYIGSTMNLSKRIKQHYRSMNKSESSIKLNDAWNKHHKFDVEIIEYIDAEKPKWFLHSRESYWINQLKPVLNASDVTGGKTEDDAKRNDYLNSPIKEHRTYIKHDYSSNIIELDSCINYGREYRWFSHDELGIIRATIINNAIWFVGSDLAYALGYSAVQQAIHQHVDKCDIYSELVSTYKGIRAMLININGAHTFCEKATKGDKVRLRHFLDEDVIPEMRGALNWE